MSAQDPTVGELLKARAVTDEQVNALVDAVLAGKLKERADLADGYVLDLAAGMKASPFATAVLCPSHRCKGTELSGRSLMRSISEVLR